MTVTTEIQLNVFDDNAGECITVGTCPDCPDYVRVHSVGPAHYWGEFDFSMRHDMARALGEALIKMASNLEGK